ncbi:L-glutamate gamma-semialdehyde dehydrogenase [Fodinicola acaciae]|uniref:L-glutamate gamma-semialdehyde dehydrogenase n=1 Tax=Fodinicola acaciae TaxID=2681555 RepID=UPI0013D36E13|nr:L-glutamate gamma-semialdehyde dehydrogenase [Fodinicola acaciae]
MDAVTNVPVPHNEPVRTYAAGSHERATLAQALNGLAAERHELPHFIGAHERHGDGADIEVVQPHKHSHVLGVAQQATEKDVADAVAAAKAAAPAWRELPYDERAAVLLRAADLLTGPWRDTLNAATMLGQSKTVQQAEIDAAVELADFFRFNAHFGRQVLDNQPISSPGVWNRFDHRSLEGFVLAITPFNFTAIAGNLPTSPALMGNTVVWKPSPTQALAAHHTMKLLKAAGLPDGVINLVHGDGAAVSKVALSDPDLAGIHFTGSTRTFQHLWRTVGENLTTYRTYPRLVGETGGKDFIIAHSSADRAALGTGIIRGAFEYQGQKCSAASRVYVPRSLWNGGLRDDVAATTEQLTYGNVTDFANFGGAVIDRRSFDKLAGVLDRIKNDAACNVIAGGSADDSEGFFVRPTVVECSDPTNDVFVSEYFGPIVAVHVFDDTKFDDVVGQAADVSPYALTGAVFANDRAVIDRASKALRFSAGNFYINDKPTGAVVGQQPFGGGRASGTNDKAGSIGNLQRWVSPRSIKETFVPPTDYRYPHMA